MTSSMSGDGKRAELNEPILADDYPVYGDYLYVADGEVIRSDFHDVTVARLKREIGAKEIRRCDISGRKRLLADSLT